MAKGYIKLHRQIQDCEIWVNSEPYDVRSAWVDLLMLANHRDKETIFDYKPLTIKRGQYLTSVRKLAERWGWSKNRVLKYLRLLENLQMIERDSNNQRTLLTIVNYEIYQCSQDTDEDTGEDTPMDTPKDTVVDTGMPQLKNDKNNKNEKNGKNGKNIYGEYKNVRLTEEERDRLFNEYGETETLEAIKYLDEYIQMKGSKYKDHNLVLRKWVFEAVEREKKKNAPKQEQSIFDAWANA